MSNGNSNNVHHRGLLVDADDDVGVSKPAVSLSCLSSPSYKGVGRGSYTGGAKFPSRLHYVLSQMEQDGLDGIMSWQPDGASFKIHDRDRLVSEVLPK